MHDPEEISAAAEKLNELKNGYHIDYGILGTKYIFKAFSDNGYIKTVYQMVTNPTISSYAVLDQSGNGKLV